MARLAATGLALVAVIAIVAMAVGRSEIERSSQQLATAARPTEIVTPVAQTSHETAEHIEPADVPVTAAPVLPYTEEEVKAMAQTVYGEAMITRSDMEMAAVAWCILNRVDSDDPFYPEGIMAVVTQNRQFHGYDPNHPVDEHIEWLVRDVLSRWMAEKEGVEDVGRTLPAEYLFFWGDGKHNHFTTEYHGEVEWDWSLPNPYES